MQDIARQELEAFSAELESSNVDISELFDGDGSAEVEAAAAKLRETGTFICQRTGRAGHQMAKPPFKGSVGAWIHANIAEETWQEWIRQGTKVINELRLDLSRENDAATYDRHMHEYLGVDEALLAGRS